MRSSRDLPYHPIEIQTPLAKTCENVPAVQPVLATILRAGLPLHQGFLNYFDHAENAFVSAYRKYIDIEHFDIHIEYIASPRLDNKILIITDPMLATGGSMELAYKALLTKGEPSHIHIVSVLASQQAIEYLQKTLPDAKTTIWCGAIDPELNEHSYIVLGFRRCRRFMFRRERIVYLSDSIKKLAYEGLSTQSDIRQFYFDIISLPKYHLLPTVLQNYDKVS